MSLSALTLMSRLSGWGPPLMTRRPNDAGDCASVHAVGGVTPQAGVLAIAVVVENVTPDAPMCQDSLSPCQVLRACSRAWSARLVREGRVVPWGAFGCPG